MTREKFNMLNILNFKLKKKKKKELKKCKINPQKGKRKH